MQKESKLYVIAEIGINHNGSIQLAKELIDIASDNGCNAVKFQKRDIDLVYSQEELDKPRESPFGITTRQQKMGLEFSIEQYKDLEKYSNDKGLDFIVSCWDLNSLKLIEENLNVKYHKVASALLTDRDFLQEIRDTGKKVILSTGMSTQDEIDKAVNILGDSLEYILACTSTYPTDEREVNINYITNLKERYPYLKAGFSNHLSGITACISAVSVGAECLEFHITKDRTMYGSDQSASIENVDVLMSSIRKVKIMMGDGIKKVYDSEIPIMKKLRKKNNL